MKKESIFSTDDSKTKKGKLMQVFDESYFKNKKLGIDTIIWARIIDNKNTIRAALFVVKSRNVNSGYMLDGFEIDGQARDFKKLFVLFTELLPSNVSEKFYLLDAYVVLEMTASLKKLLKIAYLGKGAKALFKKQCEEGKLKFPEIWEFNKEGE